MYLNNLNNYSLLLNVKDIASVFMHLSVHIPLSYHSNYGMQPNIEHTLDLCLDPQLDLDPLSHMVTSTLMS